MTPTQVEITVRTQLREALGREANCAELIRGLATFGAEAISRMSLGYARMGTMPLTRPLKDEHVPVDAVREAPR